MKFSRIEFSATAALLLVAGCSSPDEPDTQTSEPQQLAQTEQESAPELGSSEAFNLAFDGAPPATRTVDGRELSFTPGRVVDLGEGREALISLGKMADACHACSGSIAVHYLEPDGEGWRKAGEWLSAFGGSDWGEAASDWSVSRGLLDAPVLVAEAGGTAQGYSCATTSLVALLADGPKTVAEIPMLYSNDGTIDGDTTIEGEISAPVAGDHFDVVYGGTRGDQPVRFTETYRWQDGNFRLASAPHDLEAC